MGTVYSSLHTLSPVAVRQQSSTVEWSQAGVSSRLDQLHVAGRQRITSQCKESADFTYCPHFLRSPPPPATALMLRTLTAMSEAAS